MSEISLTIGTVTASVPIKLTNVQANAVLRRYAINSGIAVEGRTAAQIGVDVLKSLLRHVRESARSSQRSELLLAQLAQIESAIAADNDLFDE